MRKQIQDLLNDARRRQDANARTTYQAVIAAIQEIENRENRTLDGAAILKVIEKEMRKFTESAEAFEKAGRAEAAACRKSVQLLENLLPREVDPSRYAEIIRTAIQATGASSLRDMGKVMAAARAGFSAPYGERIDMQRLSVEAKSQLE